MTISFAERLGLPQTESMLLIECLRCTTPIDPTKLNSDLCAVCFKIMGTPPDGDFAPCFYCGDVWAPGKTMVCDGCFAEKDYCLSDLVN